MSYKRFQMLAQIVGCVTIGLLAVYGLLMVLSADSLAWAARDQASLSGVHNVINYQGMLRQPDGSVINGSYTMTFRLYYSPTASITDAVHAEVLTNTVVRDGLFTVLLGDTDSNPIDNATFKQPLYIGIQVENDAEMQPRQRIAPVPYAVQLTDGVYVDELGNVGVGTTDPQVQLDVNGDVAVSGVVSGDVVVSGKITTLATASSDISTTCTTKGYVDTKWPDGPYCILRGGTYDVPLACPSGFTEGQICLDTEDDANADGWAGTVGSSRSGAHSTCGSSSGGMVILRLCCKD